MTVLPRALKTLLGRKYTLHCIESVTGGEDECILDPFKKSFWFLYSLVHKTIVFQKQSSHQYHSPSLDTTKYTSRVYS